jgi:aspartate/methionine/tyrosine aminotransferase
VNFETYPFEKLNNLLQDIEPNHELKPMTLTIGEPQFETPDFIQEELKHHTHLLNKYPKSAGEEILRYSLIDFMYHRFGLRLDKEQIIPTFGTREVLFNFPQFYLFDIDSPKMAFTNPFYQIYEGAAIASRAEVVYINLLPENNFKPIIEEEKLKECDIVILNFPNNPTTATLSVTELEEWVKLALKHDFVLINDECYSEIYYDETNPPASLLQASINAGNESFKNILVLNSISKRSSAPGLRSGFIAGDADILKRYMTYRTYVGCAVPLPIQSASAKAWSDEVHVKNARDMYRKSFDIANDILGLEPAEATFYIWLEVGDEIEFTKRLYEKYNLKVIPGSYLGRDGIGKGYIRIALVENEKNTKEALERLKECLVSYI